LKFFHWAITPKWAFSFHTAIVSGLMISTKSVRPPLKLLAGHLRFKKAQDPDHLLGNSFQVMKDASPSKETKEQPKNQLPRTRAAAVLHSNGFRCTAYRDTEGIWRNAADDTKMELVLMF
jgi:hypothetical protein